MNRRYVMAGLAMFVGTQAVYAQQPTAAQFAGAKYAGPSPSGKTIVTLALKTGTGQADGTINFTGTLSADGAVNDTGDLLKAVYTPGKNTLELSTVLATGTFNWDPAASAWVGIVRYRQMGEFKYTLTRLR